MFDEKAFAEEVIDAVKGYVARETAPLVARAEAAEARAAELETRLAAIEARELPVAAKGDAGDPGRDGKDIDPADIFRMVAEEVAVAVSTLPAAERGVDGIGLAGAMIDREGVLVLTLSNGETKTLGVVTGKDGVDAKDGVDGVDGKDGVDGEDGTSTTIDDIAPMIASEISKAVSAIPPAEPGRDGRDGHDVDMEAVKAIISEQISVIPAPENGRDGIDGKDGASVTLDDVAPLIEQCVEKAVAAIPAPKDGEDGAGVADAMIDRDGNLTLTFTDGRMKSLGRVNGEDGQPIDLDEVRAMIDAAVARAAEMEGCPEETASLVEKTIKALDEDYQPAWQYPAGSPQDGKAPFVLNVNTDSARSSKRTTKTITTRRDADNNLVADVVEVIGD